MRKAALLLFLPLALAACKKDGGSGKSNAPAAKSGNVPLPTDPDKAAVAIVDALIAGERDMVLNMTIDPLHDELSEEAFKDYAKVIQFLGDLKDWHEESNNDAIVAKQRTYFFEFEKGEVTMNITLLSEGGVMGFKFEGDDFVAAEHGALEDRYTQFKVYDFKLITAGGDPNPYGDVVEPGVVNYQVIVGGLEATTGEHHISVEKIVLDGAGTPIYDEPVEFDLKFEENAEGIPRGVVRGFVSVKKPGKYTMELKMKDNIAETEIDYKHEFTVR